MVCRGGLNLLLQKPVGAWDAPYKTHKGREGHIEEFPGDVEEVMLKFSQNPIEPEKYLSSLIDFFKAQNDVVAVYLFGSRASGTAGPLSDIDIAVLLKEGLGKEMYSEKEVNYLSRANDILHTDEVSFVLLNKAPLTIKYGVITDAKILFSRDEDARFSFEERVMDEYMDFRPVLEEYDREVLRQIREGVAFG